MLEPTTIGLWSELNYATLIVVDLLACLGEELSGLAHTLASADSLIKRGEFDRALSEYKSGVKLYPMEAEMHYRYGILLEKMGQTKKAFKALLKVTKLRPEWLDACRAAALTAKDIGKSQEATRLFERAISLGMPSDEAVEQIAIILIDLGKFDAAWHRLVTQFELGERRSKALHSQLSTIAPRVGMQLPNLNPEVTQSTVIDGGVAYETSKEESYGSTYKHIPKVAVEELISNPSQGSESDELNEQWLGDRKSSLTMTFLGSATAESMNTPKKIDDVHTSDTKSEFESMPVMKAIVEDAETIQPMPNNEPSEAEEPMTSEDEGVGLPPLPTNEPILPSLPTQNPPSHSSPLPQNDRMANIEPKTAISEKKKEHIRRERFLSQNQEVDDGKPRQVGRPKFQPVPLPKRPVVADYPLLLEGLSKLDTKPELWLWSRCDDIDEALFRHLPGSREGQSPIGNQAELVAWQRQNRQAWLVVDARSEEFKPLTEKSPLLLANELANPVILLVDSSPQNHVFPIWRPL